jgi:hypothetical protein
MTEAEMYLIGDLLYSCGRQLVAFVERTSDKRLLIVTLDAPTIARYVVASPFTADIQKTLAEDSLKEFMAADNTVSATQQILFEEDDRVLYCAPNSDLEHNEGEL